MNFEGLNGQLYQALGHLVSLPCEAAAKRNFIP